VPPATGRIWPPTETDPPIPTPTTSHPTWALAVWPLRIVNVLEAVTSGVIKGVWGIVELAAVFAGEDSVVTVASDELTDFGFRRFVVLTSVGSGPAVELVRPLVCKLVVARLLLVGTFSLLFDAVMWLDGVLWAFFEDLVALVFGGVLWPFVRDLVALCFGGVLWPFVGDLVAL